MMYEFKNTSVSGFAYTFEKDFAPGETAFIKMPPVSANKRGINDIAWQTDGDVTLYGTLSAKPEADGALWQEILVGDEVNKAVSAIKAINTGMQSCKLIIRAILN